MPQLLVKVYSLLSLVLGASSLAACSGSDSQRGAADGGSGVQPITTFFHSEPANGCSVARVRTIFAGRGLGLRIDVPETNKQSPLLNVLVLARSGRSLPEISVFRSGADAQEATRRLRRRAGRTRGLIVQRRNIVTVMGPRTAIPLAVRLKAVAADVQAICR
jgi:hypothetical protein